MNALDPAAPLAPDEPGRVPRLTRLLRGIGAAALIASASSFLVHQWEAGSDLQRYFALLAHTVALCAGGFFCGLRIRDSKSARTFLAVAAGLLPAHFCILGGLLYSQFSWDGGTLPVASYATWVAPSPLAAAGTAAVALAVLTGVAGIAFLALVRPRAQELTVAYLGLGLPLLVPTRDPEVAALLLGASIAGLAWLELRRFSREAALRTLEGRFVRVMLAAPPVLLVARSLLHYELSWLFHAVLFAGAAVATFAVGREWSRRGPGVGDALQGLATLPAACAWWCFAAALEAGGRVPDGAVIPAFVLPTAATLLGMSLVTTSPGTRYRRAAAGLAVAGLALNLALFPGVVASLACLVVSIATLAYGYTLERKALLGIGAVGLLFALGHHVHAAIELYAFSHWGSLALLGAAVIVCASWIERHHESLRARLVGLRERVAGWDM